VRTDSLSSQKLPSRLIANHLRAAHAALPPAVSPPHQWLPSRRIDRVMTLMRHSRLWLRSRSSEAAIDEIRGALERWRISKWHIYLTMDDFAGAVANAGHVDEISALVDETLERAERNQELWAFPEVLRLKGGLMLSREKSTADLAKEYFARSLDLARAQGALSWELRTAMSFARLRRSQGRRAKRAISSELPTRVSPRDSRPAILSKRSSSSTNLEERQNGKPARRRPISAPPIEDPSTGTDRDLRCVSYRN
jgi:hypothetical protein